MLAFYKTCAQSPAIIWLVRILLIILLPLSLKVALMPLNDYVPQIQFSDKVMHFVVFFGFALLADIALKKKDFWIWNGLPFISYGALIEILQSFTPYRSFSGWDWVADILGVVAFWLILNHYRNRLENKQP